VDMEIWQITGGIGANPCGYGAMTEYWWHWSESLWICSCVRVLVTLERILVDFHFCQSTGGIGANPSGYGDTTEYWWHWSESLWI
jgi:hypothetical protein